MQVVFDGCKKWDSIWPFCHSTEWIAHNTISQIKSGGTLIKAWKQLAKYGKITLPKIFEFVNQRKWWKWPYNINKGRSIFPFFLTKEEVLRLSYSEGRQISIMFFFFYRFSFSFSTSNCSIFFFYFLFSSNIARKSPRKIGCIELPSFVSMQYRNKKMKMKDFIVQNWRLFIFFFNKCYV